MAIIKCKMCGGDITLSEDKTTGTCEYCGSLMTFPKVSDEQRLNLFNRANHFRRQGEFDRAISAYEKILEQDDADAEAHWGAVLSRYGIEYVEDPSSGERIPTCHRVQPTSILTDGDYEAALRYAPDGASRALYESEAHRIAEIQKDILAISAREKPYDVFICYKESDDAGSRTVDSTLAQEIYYQLTGEGYKVFFARITLEDKLGREYEPYIFAALNSARVMLVVGTKPEHFNAVWVKNEWSRYLDLMKKDRSRLLIPCYRDMDPYDLPDALSSLQSQDMSKIGFIQDLIRGVKKVLDAGKQHAPTVSTEAAVEAAAPGVASLCRRAELFLEKGDIERANEYAERALDIDPEYAPAYMIKLCAAMKVSREADLAGLDRPFGHNEDYQMALRFAGDAQRRVYEGYNQAVVDRLVQAAQARAAAEVERARREAERARIEEQYTAAIARADETIREKRRIKADVDGQLRALRDEADAAPKKRDDLAKQLTQCRSRVHELQGQMKAAEESCAAYRQELTALKGLFSGKRRRELEGLLSQRSAALDDIRRRADEMNARTEQCQQQIRALEAQLCKGKEESGRLSLYAQALTQEIKNAGESLRTTIYEGANAYRSNSAYDEAFALFDRIRGYRDVDDIIEKDVNISAAAAAKAAREINLAQFEVGKTVSFGHYEQDNDTTNGLEAIEWIVLAREDNCALLLSKYGLDAKPYHAELVDITWESCTLRKWLNDDFLNAAFTADEQARILLTDVDNSRSQGYAGWKTNGGSDTQDRVFLLSYKEAWTYFSCDEARKCAPTDYAIAQGAFTSSCNKVDGCAAGWWWLRSPGLNQSYAVYVRNDGSHRGSGVGIGGGVVRPALWLNL